MDRRDRRPLCGTAAPWFEAIQNHQRFRWVRHLGRIANYSAVLGIDSVGTKPLSLFWCNDFGWGILDQGGAD